MNLAKIMRLQIGEERDRRVIQERMDKSLADGWGRATGTVTLFPAVRTRQYVLSLFSEIVLPGDVVIRVDEMNSSSPFSPFIIQWARIP